MSAPVRFLAVAVAGWALFRGVTGDLLPGAEMFTISKAEAAPVPPPIVPTQFPPIAPVQPQLAAPPAAEYAAYYPAYAPYPQPLRYQPMPVYYYPASTPAASMPARQSAPLMPEQPPQFYETVPRLDDWDLAGVAPAPMPSWRGKSSSAAPAAPAPMVEPGRLDRLQLSAWALLRDRPGTGALASGGTLGGSQAGARLTYAFDRRIAVSLRSSSPVGGSRGGEVAAGLRLMPFPAVPVSITAERRQAIGRFSTGRSDFALFAEGGLYGRPLGWNLFLDGYAQAGIVGAATRDLFADGGFAVSRPLLGRFSAGLGAWGGYQPGLYRVDAGPRVSMRVRPNVSVHLDWRQRLAGAAEPASGPALTLGANF